MAQVDIIIPLYNKVSCVGRAVRSILGQSVADWRLTVVDDGSTDGSGEVVRSFGDGRIRVIKQSNQGPGAARNRGIREADSEYLAFLDADDEWYPWYLANALGALGEHSDVAMVSSMYYQWPLRKDMTGVFAANGVTAGRYELTGSEESPWVSRFWGALQAWNTVMRRDAAARYDGFYEKDRCVLGEDQTFFARVALNEAVLIIGPAAVRYHMEASDLARRDRAAPLAPYLVDPGEIMRYCPKDKQEMMEKVLAWRALLAARQAARFGRKREAEALIERFGKAKEFVDYYDEYCGLLSRGEWFYRWMVLKSYVEPRVRWAGSRLGQTIGLLPRAAKMPQEIGR